MKRLAVVAAALLCTVAVLIGCKSEKGGSSEQTKPAVLKKAVGIAPDSNSVLFDNFNDGTKGKKSGTIAYETSIPDLGQAASLLKGTYIQYSFTPWYRWDSVANKWERNEIAPGVPTEGTIEMWIKPRRYPISILNLNWNNESSTPPSGHIMNLGLTNEGKLTYSVWGGNMDKTPAGKSMIPLNEWTHIAVSWSPKGTKLYVNGVVDASTNVNCWPAFWKGSVHAYLNFWGDADLGLVDELHISKVTRTDEEIRLRMGGLSK